MGRVRTSVIDLHHVELVAPAVRASLPGWKMLPLSPQQSRSRLSGSFGAFQAGLAEVLEARATGFLSILYS